MFGLTWGSFFRAVIAGFAATFVMEVAGFWQAGLKIPRVDGAKFLADNAHRHWVWGEFAHYMNGMALGIAYGRWFERLICGPAMFKGLLYGMVTTIAADGLVNPIIDRRLGPFFMNTPRPSRLLLASLIDHLFYGVTLGLGYESPRKPPRKQDD